MSYFFFPHFAFRHRPQYKTNINNVRYVGKLKRKAVFLGRQTGWANLVILFVTDRSRAYFTQNDKF